MNKVTINTKINKKEYKLSINPNQTLLDLLREEIGLTGTKRGCEIGECGACTVLINGEAVNSCLVLAPQIDGKEILTVEGLMCNDRLHPLQQSFIDHDAAHCGYCTPGMLMSAEQLLKENPNPTEDEVRIAISGNLCRCSGYVQIVDAIKDAHK
jgi:carbon-monoxide dehydrogenase small subunit